MKAFFKKPYLALLMFFTFVKAFIRKQHIAFLVFVATFFAVNLDKIIAKLITFNVLDSELIRVFVPAPPQPAPQPAPEPEVISVWETMGGMGNRKKQLAPHYVPAKVVARLHAENVAKMQSKSVAQVTASVEVFNEIVPDPVVVIENEPEVVIDVTNDSAIQIVAGTEEFSETV